MTDQETQSETNPLDSFDNVIVLMLENRSFDNLLGYLYQNDLPSGKSFDGLQTGNYPNPVPSFAKGYDQHKFIEPSRAANYHQPFPDPGEEYEHVNTQLFNTINPTPENEGVEAYKMKKPYNLPTPPPNPLPSPAPMNGFVKDYVSNLKATYGTAPTFGQYEVIMQCFQPDQVHVLSTLAKEFAVFDHWHCSVPSQTWCNRAFWNAATSGGKVINPLGEHGKAIKDLGIAFDLLDMGSWIEHVWSQPTIFDRMSDKDISWGIYAPKFYESLTNIIHGIFKNHPLHLHNYSKFLTDLECGSLPQYSFVEPKFLKHHNDQHPSAAHHPDGKGTVLLGEELILEVYDALRKSEYKDNTLLIITHDEHGGCFDHVNPPEAVPPKPNMKGQKKFKFDRLGIRVPMVMISSFIQPNTIVNDDFDHTSFIKTVSDKWRLDHLTERDKCAKSFEKVFSPKKRDSWPEIKIDTNYPGSDTPLRNVDNDPLNDLQKSILVGVRHIVRQNTGLSAEAEKPISTIGAAANYIESVKEHLT